MKPSQPVVFVDAFTKTKYGGNPAAVCIIDEYVPATQTHGWMSNVAAEMNLSETSFLWKLETDTYSLRWFTPTVEVDLCGHATLAAAHVLFSQNLIAGSEVRFVTKSGVLTCKKAGDNRISMDFPLEAPIRLEKADIPDLIYEGFNVTTEDVVRVSKNRFDLFVEVKNKALLQNMKPIMSIIEQIPVRGCAVTCKSESPSDVGIFYSRFFAPRTGVPEDPVCGSAHCGLAPYWGSLMGLKEMTGLQISKRGGIVNVKISDDNRRVQLTGDAVITMQGSLLQ